MISLKVLSKFSKFLFRVFIELENSDSLKSLMTLVHGDAKIDNFLFKKVKEKLEETYTAMIIDWQGEILTSFEEESISICFRMWF